MWQLPPLKPEEIIEEALNNAEVIDVYPTQEADEEDIF